jgi:hypothetical protein
VRFILGMKILPFARILRLTLAFRSE